MLAITPINNNDSLAPPTGSTGNPLGYTPDGSLAEKLGLLLSNVIGILTLIAGFTFLFYFIIAAVTLVTSGDDQEKITKARTNMTQALIGIIITAAAYPIAWLITKLLGIPLADPQQLLDLIKP